MLQVLLYLILGTVIGALARLVVLGGVKRPPSRWIASGVIGALIGGVVGRVAAAGAADPDTVSLLGSFVGAVVGVDIYRIKMRTKTR
jgi:uncharacterized membrane protein YeaQ/YmgE (transglycosylase-associated protein family)